jgi:hypothetical protein
MPSHLLELAVAGNPKAIFTHNNWDLKGEELA